MGRSEHRVEKLALSLDHVTPELRDLRVGLVIYVPFGLGCPMRPRSHVAPRRLSHFGVQMLKLFDFASSRRAGQLRKNGQNFVKQRPALVRCAGEPQARMAQSEEAGGWLERHLIHHLKRRKHFPVGRLVF